MRIFPNQTTCLNISILLAMCGWTLASSEAAAPPVRPDVAVAIQAIQQAPDPSAAVAAFANGVALDGKQPSLYAAYVSRMVELGLPELAFHQAQTLTSLQSTNGLAWGVVAYVNARKADMPAAISTINLASQYAPDDRFVERTAGEIIAWYDVKADQASLPTAAKDGLAKTRDRLGTSPAYIAAYETAKQAYQNQASTGTQPPPQAAPEYQPGAQAPVPPDYGTMPPGSMVYVPEDDYGSYYDGYGGYYGGGYYWGPGWGAPPPWWWWQPPGYFVGATFCPFTIGFAFHSDDFHHHHEHDGHFHHDGHVHDAHFASHSNPALWHHDPAGRTTFFGTPAHPNDALVHSGSHSFQTAPLAAPPSSRTWNAGGQRNVFSMPAPAPTGRATGGTMPRAAAVPHVWTGGGMVGPSWAAPSAPSWAAGPSMHSFSGGAPHAMAPAGGFHGGGGHSGGPMGGGGGPMGGGGFHGGGGGHGGR